MGRVDRDGYGRSTNGKIAHRLAYEYWVGPIPDGQHVDHACHNSDPTCTNGATCMHRRCVRPDHLRARPAVENLADQYTARKTHCKQGHEFTTANTALRAVGGHGRRVCRTCNGGSRPSRTARLSVLAPRTRVQYVPLASAEASTCEVPLKGDLVALVDAADWPLVSTYKWYPRVDRGHWLYARGIRRVAGKTEWVVMHRLVMRPERGQAVRHRNSNGLDNRRSNLEFSWRTKAARKPRAS